MAKKKSAFGAYDPSTLGMGFEPGGAMELADIMGYPDMREQFGDLGHYGADFGQLAGLLQARSGMDQAQMDSAIRLLLGQEGHQTQQNVANTTANASMYGADQGLAGHKYAADVSASNAQSQQMNALQRAAMETQQRAQAATQQAQARIQAALMGAQGNMAVADRRNQGAMDVAAMKMLPEETRNEFAKQVVARSGGDINMAIGLWKELMAKRPDIGPFPGAPGGK